MAADNQLRPIIKKKVIVAGHGHHGGAWKVAYADFVTAMMAFFLLLWLLGSTTENTKIALADYFSPDVPLTERSNGGAGLLQGDDVFASAELTRKKGRGGVDKSDDEGRDKPDSERAEVVDFRAPADVAYREELEAQHKAELEKVEAERKALEEREKKLATDLTLIEQARQEALKAFGVKEGAKIEKVAAALTEDLALLKQAREELAARHNADAGDREALSDALKKELSAFRADQKTFDRIETDFEALQEHQEEIPTLKHLSLKRSIEGVTIEIAETDGDALFASGSATPTKQLKALMEIVAPIVAAVKNNVAIVGHTDAASFAPGSAYTNWELSADRANAARRLLMELGVKAERFKKIEGAADRYPLVEDPFAPTNRRIGVTLLRSKADTKSGGSNGE